MALIRGLLASGDALVKLNYSQSSGKRKEMNRVIFYGNSLGIPPHSVAEVRLEGSISRARAQNDEIPLPVPLTLRGGESL
jgi:hypothetical protein